MCCKVRKGRSRDRSWTWFQFCQNVNLQVRVRTCKGGKKKSEGRRPARLDRGKVPCSTTMRPGSLSFWKRHTSPCQRPWPPNLIDSHRKETFVPRVLGDMRFQLGISLRRQHVIMHLDVMASWTLDKREPIHVDFSFFSGIQKLWALSFRGARWKGLKISLPLFT